MLCVLPIRGFASGLSRLDGALDDQERAALACHLADHVLRVVREQADALVVTSDRSVVAWARAHSVAVVPDPNRGLDAAATAGIGLAEGGRWAVVHADLPYLVGEDVAAAFAGSGTVLAPTHDGGTSLVVSDGVTFPFAYGAGSFRRHLGRRPRARVIVRPGLALDLDTPRDLARYRLAMP